MVFLYNKQNLYQFIRFGIVGVSNTLVAYAIYSVCVFTEIHYLIANAIGFFVSVLNAYYWSDRFVFKKREGESRNVVWTLAKTYIAYGSTGLLMSSFLLYLYINKLHVSEYLAQLLVLVITIPLNYIINKLWSFKTKRANEEDKCFDSLL